MSEPMMMLAAFVGAFFLLNIALMSLDAFKEALVRLQFSFRSFEKRVLSANEKIAATYQLSANALDGEPRQLEVSHHPFVVSFDGIDEDTKRLWIAQEEVAQAGMAAFPEFNALWDLAVSTKAEAQSFSLERGEGDEVFVFEDVVSFFQPRAQLQGQMFLLSLFAIVNLLGGVVLGWFLFKYDFASLASKLLGVGAVLYFLLSQPLLRFVKTKTKLPDHERVFWKVADDS